MPNDASVLPVQPGNEPASAVAIRPATRLMRALRQEPLVHFVLLGALLFGIDALLHPARRDDHTIVVTKALRQNFIDNFDEDKARVPTEEQLQKMIDAWVGSEILYREGKGMGVDRGDEMIRDRIAYKLQLLIFDQVKVAQPTDEQLQHWFEQNHGRFDEPETVGFYMTPPSDEATARRTLSDIQAQRESADLQEKTRAVLARPVQSLAPAFGASFRDALLALPLGTWSLLQSKDGWHVVRLDSHRPGKLATLAQVRNEAARIWHDDEVRNRAWEAVKRLKTQYTIRYEP